jgi:exosortase/archaeosortase family protein
MRLVLRFSLVFLGYVLLFSVLVRIDEVLLGGAVSGGLSRFVARGAVFFLNLLGAGAVLSESTITYGSRSFRIVPECTGVEVIGLFVAAVLAFPARWKSRVRGLALGIPALAALNGIRVLTLVYAGARSPKALDYGHLYVWPVIVLGVTVALWLSWARSAARHEDRLA